MDKKYDFGLSFDEQEVKRHLEEQAALAAEESRRAAEEAKIKAAYQEGYQKGHQEGHAAGKSEGVKEQSHQMESLAAQAQKSIATQLADIAARQDETLSNYLQSSLAAAMTTLKALFPGLVRKHGLDEIETLLSDCLAHLLDEPRVLVRVDAQVAAPLGERIGPIVEQAGYSGKVVVIGHDGMAEDECRIEWKDGAAERNSQRLWQEVEEILGRYIDMDDLKRDDGDTDAADKNDMNGDNTNGDNMDKDDAARDDHGEMDPRPDTAHAASSEIGTKEDGAADNDEPKNRRQTDSPDDSNNQPQA